MFLFELVVEFKLTVEADLRSRVGIASACPFEHVE